jgi:pyruvate/2-oxoglutarate dehydrogenase complex dihydrolipoamide dehydrogenase (E3) component
MWRRWSSITFRKHLVVLGGGYVGLEFAQPMRRFGAGVTYCSEDRKSPRAKIPMSLKC